MEIWMTRKIALEAIEISLTTKENESNKSIK